MGIHKCSIIFSFILLYVYTHSMMCTDIHLNGSGVQEPTATQIFYYTVWQVKRIIIFDFLLFQLQESGYQVMI